MKKYRWALIVFIFIALSSGILISREKEFTTLDPEKITNYKLDRIVFQRIEKQVDDKKDNSVESLLVIKNQKVYYICDGYDNVQDVLLKQILMSAENKYVENNDYWTNKINGKPDCVRIIYRRSDLLKNSGEEFVSTNFGQFYKSTRDGFIKIHVDKFRNLMKNRGESCMHVDKRLISTQINHEKDNDIKLKFFKSASAKSTDGIVYYCEDADGDGITETFMAYTNDGFYWGEGCGPNIIMIYGNTDKDIETLIGKLVNECENGTVEEEKQMFKEFPQEQEVKKLMENLTPLDKYYN